MWQPHEVSRFLEVAESHRLAPVFNHVVRTGLRRGEVAGLRWEDVDLQDRERASRENQCRDDGWVFTYEDGRPLSPYYISQIFRKLVRGTGLPHLTFHGLRHEHASLLLAAGMPITAVSKRLGHASIAITSDLYSHLLDDVDRQMADAIEGVLSPTATSVHTRRAHTGRVDDVEEGSAS